MAFVALELNSQRLAHPMRRYSPCPRPCLIRLTSHLSTILSHKGQASALQDLSSGPAALAKDRQAKTGQQEVCDCLPVGLHVITDVSSSCALRLMALALARVLHVH